ncbi:unnamed protein product [Blepharisma stoltei]|uniref:EF-hand domain-containing protein n=1 Tax=Blepharisma stoltei TaxID=1481888 RepID=A0AAU9K715_9CILI|nr:unnamed protein product [Blepharisma stoltei]
MGEKLSKENQKVKFSFDKPVEFTALTLTKWTKQEILKLYNRYLNYNQANGLYLAVPVAKHVFKQTSAEGLDGEIFRLFGHKSKVNILEFVSALIIYASIDWKEKVQLTMRIFDFDGNGCFSIDEAIVLIKSFFRGYAAITKSSFISSGIVEQIASLIFKDTFNENEDTIDLEEFANWVRLHSEAKELFEINQPSLVLPKELTVKRSRSEAPSFAITPPCRTPDLTPKRLRIFRKSELPLKIQNSTPRRISVSFMKSPPKKRMNKKPLSSKPLFIVTDNIQTYTKEFVIWMYKVFNSLDLHLKDHVSIYSLISEFRRIKHIEIANKLEAYCSKTHMTKIDFKELLKIVCVGVGIFQIKRMLTWVIKDVPANESFDKPKHFKDKLGLRTAKKFRVLFQKIDTNKDGLIDLEELKEALQEDFDLRHIEEIFREYDEDKNNVIDFGEFLKMMAPLGVEVPDDLIEKAS